MCNFIIIICHNVYIKVLLSVANIRFLCVCVCCLHQFDIDTLLMSSVVASGNALTANKGKQSFIIQLSVQHTLLYLMISQLRGWCRGVFSLTCSGCAWCFLRITLNVVRTPVSWIFFRVIFTAPSPCFCKNTCVVLCRAVLRARGSTTKTKHLSSESYQWQAESGGELAGKPQQLSGWHLWAPDQPCWEAQHYLLCEFWRGILSGFYGYILWHF